MFPATATTATTTTPAVTVVCFGTLSLSTTVTMIPTLMRLPVTSGQHEVVLPPLLMLRDTRGIVLATVLHQQPQSQMHPKAYANYAMGPLQVSFSLRVEPPSDLFICVGVCCGACFLLSGATLDVICTNGGLSCWVWHQCSPLEHIHGRHVQPGDGHWPMPEMH